MSAILPNLSLPGLHIQFLSLEQKSTGGEMADMTSISATLGELLDVIEIT